MSCLSFARRKWTSIFFSDLSFVLCGGHQAEDTIIKRSVKKETEKRMCTHARAVGHLTRFVELNCETLRSVGRSVGQFVCVLPSSSSFREGGRGRATVVSRSTFSADDDSARGAVSPNGDAPLIQEKLEQHTHSAVNPITIPNNLLAVLPVMQHNE